MAKAKTGNDDTKKQKALWKAILGGDGAKVRAALAGLDINASIPSPDGWELTPFSHALRLENPGLARQLLDAGADPASRNGDGNSPLRFCTDAELAEEMIRRKVPVDERDQKGYTPLLHACWWKALGVVEVLLRHGADPNAIDVEGKSLIAKIENEEVRAVLRRHGAKAPVKSHDGRVLAATAEPASFAEVDVERGMIGAGSDGNLWFPGAGVATGSKVAVVRDDVLSAPASAEARNATQVDPPSMPLPATPFVDRTRLPPAVIATVQQAGVEGIAVAQLEAFVRPAIGWDVGPRVKASPIGTSRFGGPPDLPALLPWPTADDDDLPLTFVMQVDLADVHALDLEGLLPASGRLYFFADTNPDELTAVRVLHSEAAPAQLDRRPRPDGVAELKSLPLRFYPLATLPPLDYLRARLPLTKDDAAAIDALRTALHELAPRAASAHPMLLGWPDSAQAPVVTDEHTVPLLQLSGEVSNAVLARALLEWFGDGLVHILIGAADLAQHNLDAAYGHMAQS